MTSFAWGRTSTAFAACTCTITPSEHNLKKIAGALFATCTRMLAVLLVERECRLRWRRFPDGFAERFHPHRDVHLLLRQLAHQGYLVEEIPHPHAGLAFFVCVFYC